MTTPNDDPTSIDPPPPPHAAPTERANAVMTAAPAAAKRTRRERWRRRFFVFVTAVVLLGGIFRIALHVLFPAVLDRVARTFGLRAEYDKLDLSVLGADVGLWGLRFTPVDGGQPVIATAYCRGAISTFALLKFQLHVNRVEAEDAEVLVERLPDGSLPLIERLLGAAPAPVKPTASKTSESPASLDAPLKIDALRLQNARAHFRDGMVTPATDVTVQMDLLVRDVGAADRDTAVELQLHSPESLAALYVNAAGRSRDNQINATLDVRMVGLNLLPARAYLAPLGIVPQSQDISAQARGTLRATLNTAAATTQANTRATTRAAAGTMSASLALDDIKVTANSIEAAGVRSLRVDARELSPGAVRIERVAAAGVRARVARTEAGLLAFAGVEVGPPATPAPATRPVTKAAVATTPPGSALPTIEVDRFEVADVDLDFLDRARTPANAIAIRVPQLLIERFSTDPAKAATPARVTLAASAPGIARQVAVTGDVAAAAPVKTAAFKVNVAGIHADAIGPYLRPLGVDEAFEDASFTCTLGGRFEQRGDGTTHVSFDLADATLVDGGRELFGMPRVAIRDASYDPRLDKVRLGDIELVGPTLPLSRDVDGTIRALGFRTLTVAAPAASATTQPTTMTATAASPSEPLPSLPTFEIGKLEWRGSKVTIDDRATGGPPLDLVLDDVTARVEDLTLSTRAAVDARPGKLSFAVRAPGLVETLDVRGTATPAADALGFAAKANATGITFARVRPLLAMLGVEPAMTAGAFQAEAEGSLRRIAEAYRADLAVRSASLTDGETRWLGVDAASVRGATFDGRSLHVEAVEVDAPQALVTRDEAGLLAAAGFKLLPPPPAAKAVVAATQPAAMPTVVDLSLPIVARLDALAVKDAAVEWRDAFVLPAAKVSAVAQVTINGVVLGEDAAPATFAVDVASPGVADRVAIKGQFKFAPHEQSLNVDVTATGLAGGAIEPYLPPTVGVDLAGRNAKASVAASLGAHAEGGSTGAFELKDASLSTADGSGADAAIASLRGKVERVDLPAKTITIDELSLDGARLAAAQDEKGVHMLGVTISPTPLRAAKPAPPVVEQGAGEGVSDVGAIVRSANEALPLVTLRRLSLNADRVEFKAAALDEPVVVTGAVVTNDAEPIVLGGPTPAENPAVHLRAAAGVAGVVGALSADVRVAPFATEPTAMLKLAAEGIDGTSLTRLMPSLGEMLDGRDLSDGRFASTVEARAQFARRGPLGIDLTRDVTGEVVVRETTLTVPNDPRPLVGVQEVRADKIRVSPGTGSIVIGALDVVKPIASVVREADGIHVAGLTLKVLQPNPPAATKPAETPAEPPPVDVVVTRTESTPQPSAGGGHDARIDRLTISGLDFRIEDRVNTPHSIVPVTDMDVEIVGLSTRALTEPRPVRLSAVVTSGKVPLPPRKPKVGGPETEDREVFAEASANANLTFFPKPTGYARASISGLEFTAIRGIASEYGLTLGGGTFDGRLDVRLKSADTFEAKVWPTFNELRMKEVPDGPIQSTFRLPAPPDVVISTLEDFDGSLTFPFTVPIDAGKPDVGAIIGSAVGSVGKVLAEAMVAAPLKAGKLAAGLIGIDLGGGRQAPIEPVTIAFATGESQLAPEQRASLARVLEMMRRDPTIEATVQHELGGDDVALADSRVNLGTDDSQAIVAQLAARKRELQRRYAEQSATLVATLATRDEATVRATQSHLRETATQLKTTEDGLDSLYDLLRPGADRQASRRAKAAAILLADLRLRGVQDALTGGGLRDGADRVRRSNALFNPAESGPGRVRIVLTRRAKS